MMGWLIVLLFFGRVRYELGYYGGYLDLFGGFGNEIIVWITGFVGHFGWGFGKLVDHFHHDVLLSRRSRL